MTTEITPLDLWLSDATRGLSAESAAQVRAEIQQHYDLAREAGDDALAGLGDPRVANRAYRKVLLTEGEALLASGLTRPKRPALPGVLLNTVFWAAFWWMGWMTSKHHNPGFWPIIIAMNCIMLLPWIFPRTSIERIRVYFYVLGVRSILVVALAGWYQGRTGVLLYGVMSLVSLLFEYYFNYRIWLIFRKLGLRT